MIMKLKTGARAQGGCRISEKKKIKALNPSKDFALNPVQ
jgi:hypothetical protein